MDSQTINARVLPTVWYSKLSAQEGDTVRIYGAIQNDSGRDFSGTAKFIVAGEEVGTAAFSSHSGVLTTVSANWHTDPGNSAVQVTVVTDLPDGIKLVSDKSDSSVIYVSQKVTLDEVKQKASDAVGKVTAAIDDKTSGVVMTIVDKLEDLKAYAPNLLATDDANEQGSVLGTSTQKFMATNPNSKVKTYMSKAVDSTYDGILSSAQFVVTHWVWSISAVLVIGVIWKLWGRRSRVDF